MSPLADVGLGSAALSVLLLLAIFVVAVRDALRDREWRQAPVLTADDLSWTNGRLVATGTLPLVHEPIHWQQLTWRPYPRVLVCVKLPERSPALVRAGLVSVTIGLGQGVSWVAQDWESFEASRRVPVR